MKVNHVRIIVFLLFQFSFAAVEATHFIPAYSGNGYKHMSFVILSAQIGDSNYSVGDEIAVFDGTVCCGVGVLTTEIEYGNNESYLVFMVSANTGFSGADGFSEGHSIEIRCWSRISRREAVASLIFFDPKTGLELSSPPVFKSNSSVFVKLSVANQAPVANAGKAQIVKSNSLVTLDGSASFEPDGDTLIYKWIAPEGIVLSESNTPHPTFVVPEVPETMEYIFSLVASDGILESEPSTVTIRVNPVEVENHAPVASAGNVQTVKSDSLVTLDGSASFDPDRDILFYKWTAPAGIVLSESNTAHPTFVAPAVTETTEYIFSLVVSDGILESELSAVTIRVDPVEVENHAPVANAGKAQIVKSDSLVTLDGGASFDSDGDILFYEWTAPEGIVLSESNTPHPMFIAPAVTETTEYIFSLVVSDGILESESSEVIIRVNPVEVENHVPVASAGESQIVKSDSLVTLDGSASFDPDRDILFYKWTAPAGIVLSESNTPHPTFIAPAVTETTEYIFSLVVSDGILESEPSTVTIRVNPVEVENHAPVASAGNVQTVKSDSLVTLDGSASFDLDGDTLIYKWTAPEEIVLSESNTPHPTFIAPAVTETAEYIFSLVVSDGILESEPSAVTIRVDPVEVENHAPVANAGKAQIVKSDSLVTLDGSASFDPDRDILFYKWTAPAGIVLSESNTAHPTFVAPAVTETTEYIFSLVVSDGILESEPSEVIIQVSGILSSNSIVKDKNATVVYPNPFSEQVYFNCAEFEGKTVVISIYNNLGVSVFCSGWDFFSGNNIFVWDGTNNNKAVPSGFYHCIISDLTGKTRKITVVKK